MDVNIQWAGQNFELLADRALFWREKATLILSDVHLGKAHVFQTFGVPVPAAVHMDDLLRFENQLAARETERVFVLGDFLHSHLAPLPDLRERFSQLRAKFKTRWHLALGNHERLARKKLEAWKFDEIAPDFCEDGIIFSHDERPGEGFVISGHVHPVIKFGRGRDRFRLPCFAVGPSHLLLPSFGNFTGGFEINPRPEQKIFAIGDGKVFALKD